ncbi:hypothetical protein BKA65DRAFT_596811 [Rhexocercosporidium sp. MPI-PUGE-AT-0058]|nr:hypothetical protein BKA65DRAFT_596811 [Rhexocercosporidium sp. MPI-PUGE-AT-0058]
MQLSTIQTMIQPESQRRLGSDDEYTHCVQETTSRHHSPSEYYHTFSVSSENSLDDFIVQSWIPEPIFDLSWNTVRDAQAHWQLQQQQLASLSSTGDFSAQHGQTVTYPLSATDSAISIANSHSQPYNFEIASKVSCGTTYHQPCIPAVNQIAEAYGHDYPSQTPQVEISNYQAYPTSLDRIIPSNASEYTDISAYDADLHMGTTDATWISFTSDHPQQHSVPTTRVVKFEKSTPSPVGLALDWSTSEQSTDAFKKKRKSSLPSVAPKRKYASPRPAPEEAQPDCHLEECVGVFENAPGALATVKKRKKLDAPVRKAARDVRKAGACHQCRFRKRTCSTGTPCGSCLKNGKGLHEIKCQRESPFIGKPVHEYFEYSSTRRVVTFNIRIAPDALLNSEEYFVFVDGVDRLSHPIKLRARRRALSSFTATEQATIRRTQDRKKLGKCVTDDDSIHVTILEDDETLGTRVEQWAVEYASKFVHAAGSKFQSTTIAVILGTAYVKKGLPESALVAAMLRVASLAFILRAGVKCTTSPSQSQPQRQPKAQSRFRTTEATIDTILYQRLQLAVKDLFSMLQCLVFRKAGFLTREQAYPVALVFWQLLRILCLGASHLSNIVQRFNSKARTQSDAQYHSLKLVLSTHLALFRSSNPLLLGFSAENSDKANHDLLANDKHLLALATQMRDVVMAFRERGCPEMKGSLAFRKEYFDLFRGVYEGL